MLGDIVKEFALHLEWPSRQRDFDLTGLADAIDGFFEKIGHMCGVGWRTNGGDAFGFRNFRRCR